MVANGQASLLVQGGPNSGMTVSLTGRPITLGRRYDNDVVIDEATVSRKHALIIGTPSGYALRDLNTTNGTFVNRQKVGLGEHVLKHGDRIKLAGSEMTFLFRHEGFDTQKMSVDAPPTGVIELDSSPQPVSMLQPMAEPPAPVAPQEPVPAAAPRPEVRDKEARLLRLLESRKGAAVSREEIARSVWPELPAGSTTNQEIGRAVQALRADIEEDAAIPKHLITVGEFGYLLI